MSFSSVDLPAPLRPMTAMRSPGSMDRSTWSSSSGPPTLKSTDWRVMRGIAAFYAARGARPALRAAGQHRATGLVPRPVGPALRVVVATGLVVVRPAQDVE